MLLNFFCSALFNLLPACHFSISSRSDKMRALASCTNGSKKLKKASFFSLTSEYSEKLGRGASTAVTAVLARLSGLESHPAKESNSAKINIFLINTSDQDRKSTRLNSSHVRISYAVFCLKKKKK